MKAGQKMTRAAAEKALQKGTLSPQDVLEDRDGYPNRHVRLRAAKMVGQTGTEEHLKVVSAEVLDRMKDGPVPRWVQKFLG